MTPFAEADPVLRRFRTVLDAVYGARLSRVVLYGSRARGDAAPDSDYDVAVFLDAMPERWGEIGRLAKLQTQLLDELDVLIEARPYDAATWWKPTPLMHEIRRDGRDL